MSPLSTDTDSWEGFTKDAIEKGSGAMIYIPKFIKAVSGIPNLISVDSEMYRQDGNHMSLLRKVG
jgi:hypothetical protein